jgi:hypothetical protein
MTRRFAADDGASPPPSTEDLQPGLQNLILVGYEF